MTAFVATVALTLFVAIGATLAFWTPVQAEPCTYCHPTPCANSRSCPYKCTCLRSGPGLGKCVSLN